jgi:hypothetical protein
LQKITTLKPAWVVLFLGTLLYATFGAVPIHAAGERKNLVGGEIGYILRPFGATDPYSWALGGSVFYERRKLFRTVPVLVGVDISVHGFYPLEGVFEESVMLRGGLYAGYAFEFPFHEDFALSLAPYLGYSHYWRKIWFDSSTVSAYRPILRIGLIVDASIENKLVTGQNVEGLVIFDKRILFTLGQSQRFAWRF